MKRKNQARNKKYLGLPLIDGKYFFCEKRGSRLPADPRVCKRCTKRCDIRGEMIVMLTIENKTDDDKKLKDEYVESDISHHNDKQSPMRIILD